MNMHLSATHGVKPEPDLPVTANLIERLVAGEILPEEHRVAIALRERNGIVPDFSQDLLALVKQNIMNLGESLGQCGSLASFAQSMGYLIRSYFEVNASFDFDMVSIPPADWQSFQEIVSDRIGDALVADLFK